MQAIAEAATSVTVHLESRNRFEEIAASSDEMLTLFELARTLSANMGGQDATDLIAKHLRRLVPSSACVFYMYEEESDDLVAAYASGEHSGFIKGLRVPRGQRLTGWVAANRLTIRNSDPVLDLGESARAMAPRPRSSLSTPLLVGNRLAGVLSLYSSNREAYSEDHERILEVIARQVSGIVLDAYVAERAKSHSRKDKDTGLPNLTHFFEVADGHLGSSHQAHPFCLAVIRVTSHASSTLTANAPIVTAIRHALRPADLLFSADPEELVTLLLNTDNKGGESIAARISGGLESLRLDGLVASWRVGTACAPAEATDAEALLRIARERIGESGKAKSEAVH
jgi:transcriptional regulator with GAF, ATPase, and Fis domain